jgi:hypothetical protein
MFHDARMSGFVSVIAAANRGAALSLLDAVEIDFCALLTTGYLTYEKEVLLLDLRCFGLMVCRKSVLISAVVIAIVLHASIKDVLTFVVAI